MTNFQENGLVARIHGNVHRRPKHSLSFYDIESVVRFLLSYVEQHGLLLPGRVPGYSQSDIKLLPSSSSKRGIWKSYKSAVVLATTQTVAYSTFCRLWRELLPSIIVMKSMSDLCWHCQQNSSAILHATNCSENEKTKTIQVAEEHEWYVWREHFTKIPAKSANTQFEPISQLIVSFRHHSQLHEFQQTQWTLKCTTVLTMPNKCIFPQTCFNQDPFTF